MKKFLCFFGIFALIAGFVTSCGDDDDDDDGNGTPGGKTVSQKKLKKLVDGNESWEYVYDKDGRCTSYTEFDHNQPVEKINYKYESNKIIEESCLLDGTVRSTITIILDSNGKIESETCENGGSFDKTVYAYDNQGQLISESYSDEESGETSVTTYTWENGNVSKIEVRANYNGDEYNVSMSLEYTNSTYATALENKVGFNWSQMEDGFISQYLNATGKTLKNLPVAIKYEGEERNDVQTLTWTFDGDGYPVKVVSKNVFDVDTLEFVWE